MHCEQKISRDDGDGSIDLYFGPKKPAGLELGGQAIVGNVNAPAEGVGARKNWPPERQGPEEGLGSTILPA
jgi:hypothetical protein